MNADESGLEAEAVLITKAEYDHVVRGVASIAWAEGHRAGITDATSVPRTGMTYAVTENPYGELPRPVSRIELGGYVMVQNGHETNTGSHQDAATVEVALGSTATTNGPQIAPEVAGSQHATTDHAHGRGAGDGVGL